MNIFFDQEFYRNNSAIGGDVDPEIHYSTQGWRLGYNPSPYFDTRFYLQVNSDVAAAGIDPLGHYLNFGWRENRSPWPGFDPREFSQSHVECFDAIRGPASQCISTYGTYQWKAAVATDNGHAIRFRQNFRPYFDPGFYLENCMPAAETEAAGIESAFSHFLERSRYLDYDPSPSFDMHFYRDMIKDNYGWLADPVYHYLRFGVARNLATRRSNDLGIIQEESSLARSGPTQLCVHVHCFYVDLIDDFVPCFASLPSGTKIVITIVEEDLMACVADKVRAFNGYYQVTILVVKNIGRDLAPFVIDSRPIWENSDLVLHLHTKMSRHVPWGHEWRRYLIRHTIGSAATVNSVISRFRADPTLGCLYPRNFPHIRRFIFQEKNNDRIRSFLSTRNVDVSWTEVENFPAGSMAWYRADALKIACEPAFSVEEFESEAGQYDGTFAHILERAIPMRVRGAGFKTLSYVSQPYSLDPGGSPENLPA